MTRAVDLSTSEPRCGRKLVERLISEAVASYMEGMDAGILKILEEWEEKIKQEDEFEEEMENWKGVILDPRNTRGRLNQF